MTARSTTPPRRSSGHAIGNTRRCNSPHCRSSRCASLARQAGATCRWIGAKLNRTLRQPRSGTMDFGASMFMTDYSIGAVELAQALEARGFESMWNPEHSHIPLSRKSPFPGGGGDVPKMYYDAMDPFITLSAAAVATKTLKL